MFLSPGYQLRNGGILSIASLYEESKKLTALHGATVVLCTIPGDPALLKYDWFPNDNYLLGPDAVLSRCQALKFLMIHVPEYKVNCVADWLESKGRRHIASEVRINILLQNIDQIEHQNVDRLARLGETTCSTAHEAYSTRATRERLGIPLHRMSVYISPEQYQRTGYEAKDDLLIVSPDPHPFKQDVLARIRSHHPALRIQVIEKLSYTAYKEVASRAKWALTFGEGLDNYFAEPIFSGSLAFAVFNPRFFTPDFQEFEVIYNSWEDVLRLLPSHIARLDEPAAYASAWDPPYQLLSRLYNNDVYRRNLRRFYCSDYTFP